MPSYTTNFNFAELAQGDTVQSAVTSLNGNFSMLDDFAHITGAGTENGWTWLQFQVPGSSADYVIMWGNFTFADAKYNCKNAVATGGPYKSISQPTDPGMVTQAFPTAVALSAVDSIILLGGGDPDGVSTAGYPHYETQAALHSYTTSNGMKTGINWYWICPVQETGANVWAKLANVVIFGRL